MKFLKSVFFSIFIFIFLVLNAANVYAALNNKNVFTGFFHQKGGSSSISIKDSFSSAFKNYLNSGKPYFVFAYTFLKKPPYFNFDKKINLVRIKKIGLIYHSNYIITGSISKLGSSFTMHAMLIDVADVYKSKTLNYSGAGNGSLKKDLNLFSEKVAGFIYGRIRKNTANKQNSALKRKIYAVRVKGNIRVGAGFIENRIKIKKGSPYSIKKINESVKKLYKTGYFKNILVDVSSFNNQLVITFIVSERPYIKSIKYTGNGSVSVKKIKKVINLKVDSPYSSYSTDKAVKILKFIYSAEGYYNAKIKVKKKSFPGNYVGLHFIISENSPVMVRNIKFKGNTSFPSAKLASVMGVKTVNLLTWITGAGKFKKAKLNSQIIRLLSFYYNHGYINVSVKKPEFIFSKNKKYVTVVIRIVEGPQYRISKINLFIKGEKNNSKEYNETAQLIITKAGSIFNRKNIEKEILSITTYFTNKGYAFANVEPSIKIKRKSSSVIVTLIVHKGKIAKFGKITITGNDITYSYVILRALVFYPGEKYNPKLIKASRQNLKNLMYFKHVTITTEKVPGKSILNVKVHVKEQNTGKFTIGGGYSSATSFMAISSISESNLFGTGMSASFNVQAGGPYQSYSINILQPYLTYIFARPLSFNLSLYDTFNSLYYEFAYRSVGGSVTLGYPLYGNVLTEYFRYLLEQDNSVIIPGLSNILPQGKVTTSEVSLTTVYNTLNNPIVPTAGDMDSFRISYAGNPIGGNDDFVKYVAQANHYIPLWWGTSFMQGAQFGYITPTRASQPLQIYQRFFVGGIMNNYPLLGFMYDSVGPNENGNLIGGTKMLTVQAKYFIPILKRMKFYGFLWWNAGNAWQQNDSVFPLGLVQAAGIGFNWYSPFGPITITYGEILGTAINGNNKTRIQFSLGEGLPGI
ncbi:MAG: outer membrane protein assembly factor BamA [bacterium]